MRNAAIIEKREQQHGKMLQTQNPLQMLFCRLLEADTQKQAKKYAANSKNNGHPGGP